jgi:putative ABC transport system ATP-binding protein
MMVTHNMRHALRYGNRLLMMHNGRIVVDVAGEAKQLLEVNDLMRLFERSAGEEIASDRMLLS